MNENLFLGTEWSYMRESHTELNKIIRDLEQKGIIVEKTKSRNDIWKALKVKQMPNVKLELR
nr:Lmo0850 family protein [Listeria sp. ILCC792]